MVNDHRPACMRPYEPQCKVTRCCRAVTQPFPHLADLGQGHLHTPELALVPQAELAHHLKLSI